MGIFETYWPVFYFLLGMIITWSVWVTRNIFERKGCVQRLEDMFKQYMELHTKNSDSIEKNLSDRLDKLERK